MNRVGFVSGADSSESESGHKPYFAQSASQNWASFLEERERVSAGIFGRCRVTDSGCWEMTYSPNSSGYINVFIGGKRQLAHRVMYTLMHGRIPHGFDVCHSCDNRICVNPMHLAAGTPRENIREAAEGGATSRRCTPEIVAEIHRLYAEGVSRLEISRRTGFSPVTVAKHCRVVANASP